MDKPREFWLWESVTGSDTVIGLSYDPGKDTTMCVIEKSAYDKAIRMLKHIKQHMQIVMGNDSPKISSVFMMSDKVLKELGEN